jgi:hypothetical protein
LAQDLENVQIHKNVNRDFCAKPEIRQLKLVVESTFDHSVVAAPKLARVPVGWTREACSKRLAF